MKIWRICLSGVGLEEPKAYRKNLKWLIEADTAESATQLTMKYAKGETYKMVQVVIWSVEYIGELIKPKTE